MVCYSCGVIIQVDSREQRNQEILKYFESVDQKYVISKLYAGDYCNLNKPTVLIDVKKDIEEVIGNLTHDHQRFREEIRKANEDMGCKLIILIRQPLANLEAVKNYEVRKYSKWNKARAGQPMSYMKMETLYKIMKTMQDKYNIEWRFTTREEAGKEIIKILCETTD